MVKKLERWRLAILVVLVIIGLVIGFALIGPFHNFKPGFSTPVTLIHKPSIDERNAAASAAVTYESGAGFVEALERAGVPCAKQTVTPLTVSSSLGPIHVADSVGCIYSDDDYVNAFVAWPSEIGREYFSGYFEHMMEAKSGTGAQSLTLKGELWFAEASDDQRLFDTQEALGGQLIKP